MDDDSKASGDNKSVKNADNASKLKTPSNSKKGAH